MDVTRNTGKINRQNPRLDNLGFVGSLNISI